MPASDLKNAVHDLVVQLNDKTLEIHAGNAKRIINECVEAAIVSDASTSLEVARRLQSMARDWADEKMTLGEVRSYIRYEVAILVNDPANQKGA